ncbi:hypothetical protein [Methylibium sp.]|uniref:hypothetical protein n=1 Tax=Methylibium sp. TaxID=2067992 RepID=UPI00286BEE31|nr:hypothetical protein [Methylibium sp.]
MSTPSARAFSTANPDFGPLIAADVDALADLMRRCARGRSQRWESLRGRAESLHAFTGPRLFSMFAASAVAVSAGWFLI